LTIAALRVTIAQIGRRDGGPRGKEVVSMTVRRPHPVRAVREVG
jgi:hypothetical protein